MGQLLQLFPVSRRAAAGHRGRRGNYDDAVFHRLQSFSAHSGSGGLHIHLLQVSAISFGETFPVIKKAFFPSSAVYSISTFILVVCSLTCSSK